MTHANNNTSNSTPITNLDYNGMRHGYDALINSVILSAINDLGHDALNDEGTLDWIALTDLDTGALHHAISAMPLKADGTPDARPAMRRIMESLDARDQLVDVVVQFDQVELENVAEPTVTELENIDFDAVLENVIWNMDGE